QEVNMSGVGNDTTQNLPATKDNLFNENEALGAFKYYYWVPWDLNTGAVPTASDNLDDLYQNDTANFDFRKLQYHQGSSAPYDNIWEALTDNGVARPGSHADINSDGYTRWLPSYPWLAGQPGFDIDADFNNRILLNYPAQPIPDQPPIIPNQGNGSWTYHGRTIETDWEPPTVHTDDVWFDIIINSSVFPEEDLNEDNETNDLKLFASDDDYYTGSTFEEFYLKVGNQDPNIEMRDVQAQLFLPTNFQKGGLVFYKNIDTATVQRIDPFENISMNYRLSVDAVTPPGYYYGSLQIKYTKRYQVSQLDPLGNPLTVDVPVTESHWVVQIMVDYT
ncbi:MAG: hypothetical protein KAJ51_13095, partial [Thermoplasmata archaeon]|nr:hypothetical protein [Thermoplasmata archaeon]